MQNAILILEEEECSGIHHSRGVEEKNYLALFYKCFKTIFFSCPFILLPVPFQPPALLVAEEPSIVSWLASNQHLVPLLVGFVTFIVTSC